MRLEKHALDQERLALQALEAELGRLRQEWTAAGQIPRGDMLGGEPLPGGGYFLPQPPQLALERLQRQPLLIEGMLLQTHEQLRGATQRH